MDRIQKPVRIGNSKGARIPAALIRTYHLDRGFRITPLENGILIEPATDAKLSLEESFAAMAEDSEDRAASEPWAETGLSDGIED